MTTSILLLSSFLAGVSLFSLIVLFHLKKLHCSLLDLITEQKQTVSTERELFITWRDRVQELDYIITRLTEHREHFQGCLSSLKDTTSGMDFQTHIEKLREVATLQIPNASNEAVVFNPAGVFMFTRPEGHPDIGELLAKGWKVVYPKK